MNELIPATSRTAGNGTRKALAMFSAVLFIGVAVYASRASLPSTPASAAERQVDARPAAQPTNAVAAANAFLEALDVPQREKALFEFNSPKKSTWSNLPVAMVARNGVRLGELNPQQRSKALDVVAAVLSKGGYQKVLDIMDGDQKLAEGGGGKGKGGKGGKGDKGKGGKGGKGPGGGAMFGIDLYHLAIFGKPSETEPWMVQFGGHHLGVNVTVVGKTFVLTPTHTGAQPALFTRDGKEVRPLGLEVDTAYTLMGTLDDRQRAQAVIADRPQGELLLGPGRDGQKIEPKGIKGSALSATQQGLLLDVIGAWVNMTEPATAAARMAAIKEKIGDTYFAWSGPTTKGSAAYFRVQGPAVVIEYAPQGGTDHIHTVIRNPEDDYGLGLLKR
jgi:hypothetical protein